MVMGSCCHIFYFTYLFSLIPSEKSRFGTWPLGQKVFVFNIGNFPWITILYKYGSSLCALRAPLVYLDYFALEMKIDTWPDGNISSCNCVARENITSASNRFETREISIYNIGLRVTLYVTQIYIYIYWNILGKKNGLFSMFKNSLLIFLYLRVIDAHSPVFLHWFFNCSWFSLNWRERPSWRLPEDYVIF